MKTSLRRLVPVPGAHPPRSRLRCSLRAFVVAVCAAVVLPGSALGAVADVGYKDGSFTAAGAGATGTKPESKLWWNDGYWWASMWDPATSDYHIFRLNTATQAWTDTGVTLDTRGSTRADTLWDGTHLYVASHVFAETPKSGNPTRLYRYSYNPGSDSYTLDSGFPVQINNSSTETLVIDKDSTGTLWATWVQGNAVYVSRTASSDRSWGTPFVLPVADASGLISDDISSLIAFGGDKIGVMWSNQTDGAFHFSVHVDGEPDTAWTVETVLPGPNNSDDHINLKTDSSGRVFAAAKTAQTANSAPFVILLVRDPATANWTSHTFGRVIDQHTRGMVLLDETRNMIHMFATAGQSGGTIYGKTSPMDTISFASGLGTPVIQDGASANMNNATSTKQNVSATTGLAVLASNSATFEYWHNFDPIGGTPDTTPPSAPTGLTATAMSSSRVDLAWTAATDDVGVSGYEVYRDGALLATVGPTTSYSDTTVAALTTYEYKVKARDAAGNVSDFSNAALVTTPPAPLRFSAEADSRVEEARPSTNYATGDLRVDGGSDPDVHSYLRFAVTGITGTVESAKLRVYASTDTVDGPSVYSTTSNWSETGITWSTRPVRTSGVIDDEGAIPTGTWVEYDVTSLIGGNVTHSFVLAGASTDGINFHSREQANRPELVLTLSADGTLDTTPPSAPTDLAATAMSPTRVDLTWTAATDDVGVTGYEVYRDGSLLAEIGAATSYSDPTVAAQTTYVYQVKARDQAGNISDFSNAASATTPAAPLRFIPEADSRVEEATPSTNYGTGDLRVDGGTDPDVESYLRFTVTGVSGNIENAKLRLYASTGTVDGPAVYTTTNDWSETGITWSTRPARDATAADDEAGVPAGAWVEYDVTSLVNGDGTYSFVLAGVSTDGLNFHAREHANRPELVVTAASGGTSDTTPPSAPTNLSATAVSSSRVDLGWTAATDDVGVAGYNVYRDGALIATIGTETSYSDATVAPGTTFQYQVKARDGAGNLSEFSNTATVTTPAVLTFAPEADSRVEEGTPSTNYGTGDLRVDGGSDPDVESYLRFTVTEVSGTVQSVKLRLYASSGTVDGPSVYGTTNDWTETGITWSTRPARSATATADAGAVATGTWIEYDVTALVSGAGTFSFVLAGISTDGLNFHARENGNKPQLIVTVG